MNLSSVSNKLIDTNYSFPAIMLDMDDNFPNWLLTELENRGWSQAKLAKIAGVSRTAISDAISEKNPPGFEVCIAIAKAFKLPPEEVMRIAKLLPQISKRTSEHNRLLFLFDRLSPEQQRYALKLLEALGDES